HGFVEVRAAQQGNRGSNLPERPSQRARCDAEVEGPVRRRRAGFTLVELLVVLLITALLIGSASAILRSVASAREIVENRLNGEQSAVVALRTITASLRNAYRPVDDSDVRLEGILEHSEPYAIG